MCERIALCAAVALLAAGLEPAAAQVQAPTAQPPEKHYQAARAALMEGNMDRADLEVKLALQDNPLDAASHFMLGCLLERKGENDQAIVGFQRALTLDATNPEALYNLGDDAAAEEGRGGPGFPPARERRIDPPRSRPVL
jgi:Flp pilus assembly protein TadD